MRSVTAYLLLLCFAMGATTGQEAEPADPGVPQEAAVDAAEVTSDENAAAEPSEAAADEAGSSESSEEALDDLVQDAQEHAEDLAKTLDGNTAVQRTAKNVLEPIQTAFKITEWPWFYWAAFALMTAGVVSFAFQLVLGKLVVLLKGSFNIREILSDAVGLVISATGLILTTELAGERSGFSAAPSEVLSAAGVGIVVGLILYRWNQAEEVDAARGRRRNRSRK